MDRGHPSYTSHLAAQLYQLRQENCLCDVTIIVDNNRFPAHKAVLSASSSYFKSMFTSGFQESKSSEVTLHVEGSAESFKQILEFVYIGYFKLSTTNVCDIFRMVCYMDFTPAIDVCNDYIQDVIKSVSAEDGYEMYLLAKSRPDLAKLAKKLRMRLVKNFGWLVKMEYFSQVSKEFLEMCLTSKEIEFDSSTEEEILQNIMKWLKYDWCQRKTHTLDLLKKIRLGLVPVDKLKHILGDEVLAIPECKNLVDEVFKLHATKESATAYTVPLIQSHPDTFATRNTVTKRVYISEWILNMSLCYRIKSTDDYTCDGTRIAKIPPKLYVPKCTGEVFGNIIVGNRFYLAGGCEYHRCEDARCQGNKGFLPHHFFRFNPETNEWEVLPSMSYPRSGPGLVELHGYIYAIACLYEKGRGSNKVERFHIEKQEWEPVPSLPYRLRFIAAVCFEGYIFVTGRDCNTGRFLVYNPTHSHGRWSSVDVYNLPDDFERFLWFDVHKKVCSICSKKFEQTYQVTFDFKCDNPSVRIGQKVNKVVAIDGCLTFDKLKLTALPDENSDSSDSEDDLHVVSHYTHVDLD
ncbi:kelch-like protein 13 [Amphiura filiformis]|uniref:kelch-like protein 13 n=1 Tax=Amphiura filiformis TaxID=82378 RepID=UPI003B21A916